MVGTCLGESAKGEGGLRSRGTCQATAPVATDFWGDLRPSPTFPTPQSLPVSRPTPTSTPSKRNHWEGGMIDLASDKWG